METKIEIINDWTLKRFFDELETGKIRIPRFQRDYVWERTKVVRLLNSIYLQYPIGTFFLWNAPQDYHHFVRSTNYLEIEEKPDNDNYHFILDGQQRIVSIFVSLKGKTVGKHDYSKIGVNLKTKRFAVIKSKGGNDIIPAWKIFDKKEFGLVKKELEANDKKMKTRLAQSWQDCHDILMEYPISIVITKTQNLDDVVEIFERINQGGNRLTSVDLVHATVWSEQFDLKEKIQRLNEDPKIKKHGGVSNKLVINSLSINAFDDCRSTSLLKLTTKRCSQLWPVTVTSVKYAMDFLESLRIQNDMVPYHSQLTVLQYYFFQAGGKEVKEEHRKPLADWFWDAKLSKRYSVASTTKMKEDINWILELLET